MSFRFLRSFIVCAPMCVLGPSLLFGQSQTTTTLHLRNTQAQQISLTVPTAGVVPYTLTFPAQVAAGGQVLSVASVTGSAAQLAWSDVSFWSLQGSSITAGGTAAGQQYLGTANAQDLVLAANGVEAVRMVGVAGAQQGYMGFGTSTPRARFDFADHVLLSNAGTASELRFAEPASAGTEYTAFRAAAQSSSITYTLPTTMPSEAGHVLTTTPTGELSWTRPLTGNPMGVYVPITDQWQHVIPVGAGVLTQQSIPVITLVTAPGTTIGVSVTGLDATAGTITVETSVPLTSSDRLAWAVFNP